MVKPQTTNTSFSDSNLTIIVDEVSTSLFYIGKAAKGSVTSDPVWQIQRISQILNKTYIEQGSETFSDVFDDRYTLVYS